jgi:hypothetical protein
VIYFCKLTEGRRYNRRHFRDHVLQTGNHCVTLPLLTLLLKNFALGFCTRFDCRVTGALARIMKKPIDRFSSLLVSAVIEPVPRGGNVNTED